MSLVPRGKDSGPFFGHRVAAKAFQAGSDRALWAFTCRGGLGCRQRANLAVFPGVILDNTGNKTKPLSVEAGGRD